VLQDHAAFFSVVLVTDPIYIYSHLCREILEEKLGLETLESFANLTNPMIHSHLSEQTQPSSLKHVTPVKPIWKVNLIALVSSLTS
jgi:hypothetical protein